MSSRALSAAFLWCRSGIFLREAVIFIVTAAFFSFWALLGVDFHHDGVMLIPAIRVAQGQVMFRDIFCQYGILTPLLQGAAVALFGGEVLVIRFLTVLFYAGSSVLLDLIWRRFLPRAVSFGVPLMFMLFSACQMVTFHSWNSVYALFFMLLSGYFVLRFLEDGGIGRLFLAGLSAGLTAASRTPCGAVTIFAALLTLAAVNLFSGREKREIFRENAIYLGGCVSVAAVFLPYIALSGAWDDFILQNFFYVFDFVSGRGGGGSWQYFCNSMFPFYQEEYWFCHAFFAVMPLGAMVMLYLSLRKGILDGAEAMRREMPLIFVLLLGLGSWHQYYPVPCVRHLFWGGAPLFGAYLLMLCRLAKRRGAGLVAAVLLSAVLLLGLLPRGIGVAMRWRIGGRVSLDVPGIRGLLLNRMEADFAKVALEMNRLPAAIRERGMLNWSEDSLFSVLVKPAGFRHPQFYRIGHDSPYRDHDAAVMRYITAERPPVFCDHDVFIPGYVPFAEAVFGEKHYRLLVPLK